MGQVTSLDNKKKIYKDILFFSYKKKKENKENCGMITKQLLNLTIDRVMNKFPIYDDDKDKHFYNPLILFKILYKII